MYGLSGRTTPWINKDGWLVTDGGHDSDESNAESAKHVMTMRSNHDGFLQLPIFRTEKETLKVRILAFLARIFKQTSYFTWSAPL